MGASLKRGGKKVAVESSSSSEDDANVGYRLTVKRNLGNYESAEVSVSIHVGCSVDDVDAAWEALKEDVSTKVEDAFLSLGVVPDESDSHATNPEHD